MSEAVEKAPPRIVTLEDVGRHLGEEIYVKGLVLRAELGTTKNGKPFAKLTIVDGADEIEARIWDCPVLPATSGDVVGFRAEVTAFNGQAQIKVLSLKVLDEPADNYVRTSHLEDLDEFLRDLVSHHIEGEYREICDHIIRQHWDEFIRCPAASRNHHAYIGGLAEHTCSMMGALEMLIGHYEMFYGDPIDRSLAHAGVFLHDLGKVLELEEDGVEWKRGVRGELVGHIPEVALLIHDACLAVAASDETEQKLLHVVLAHHGRQEWGSPVEPRMMEALLVHQVDMIDSRMGMMREALRGVEPGEMSDYVRPLGGRVVR